MKLFETKFTEISPAKDVEDETTPTNSISSSPESDSQIRRMPMNFQMSQENPKFPEIPDEVPHGAEDTVDGGEVYKGEKSKNSQVLTFFNFRLQFP